MHTGSAEPLFLQYLRSSFLKDSRRQGSCPIPWHSRVERERTYLMSASQPNMSQMVHKFHAKCNFVPLWQTKNVVIHWPPTSWRSHQSSWQFPRSSASSLRNQMISAKIQCSYTYYQWRCFQRRGAASVSNRGFEVEVKTLIGGEKWGRRTLSPRYAAVVQVSMSIFTKESM